MTVDLQQVRLLSAVTIWYDPCPGGPDLWDLQGECAPVRYSGLKVAVSTTGVFQGEEFVVYEPLPYTALPVFTRGAESLETMKREAIVQEIWMNPHSLQALKDMEGPADSAAFMTGLFQTDETSTPPAAAAFGIRLRGIFTPQESGEYVWFIASDEPAELWFGPQGQPQQNCYITRVWQLACFRYSDCDGRIAAYLSACCHNTWYNVCD